MLLYISKWRIYFCFRHHNTPVIPQQYLPLFPGFAERRAWTPSRPFWPSQSTLRRSSAYFDRVGSPEPGKDADIVLAKGNHKVNDSEIVKVIVDGKLLVK